MPTKPRSQVDRLQGPHSPSPPSEPVDTHSTNSLDHSNLQLTPDSNGSIQYDGGDGQPPATAPRLLHLPPLETSFEDNAIDHEDNEDANEAQRRTLSHENKSGVYEDEEDDDNGDDDEGYESHDESKPGSGSGIAKYSPDEEKEVVKKFDRKLVFFLAILYLLSFLDRSSQLQSPSKSPLSLTSSKS